MDAYLINIDIAPEYTTILIVLVAWICERLIPTPNSASPLTFWRLLCARMRDKVVSSNDAKRQHTISGVLGFFVLLSPFLAIIYTIYFLADVQALLDLLILYVCLEYSQLKVNALRVKKALANEKKQLARDILQSQIFRQTRRLSPIGITKALIECMTLRFIYQQCCVIILYCIGGIILALIYRLAYEAHQTWNIKVQRSRYFGYFSYLLTQVLQFIPVKITNILLVIAAGKAFSYRKLPTFLFSPINWQASGYPTFHALSIALNVHVGGTVMREGIKYKRDKCYGKHEPKLSDIQRTLNLLDRTLIILFCIILLVIWSIVQAQT
ncbi:cobalamin biosynthesis protein CobD/CbiB [Agaribacter marinus]|uniref:Adenosylcobinamide-phosphate synthase n=1 Tax=Agaribacter marinus TaxID=1431249 RepID=A0AA37T0W5_9ALTE|nr:cobalamin biosynthesis protein [Agaribacter marinus]GLR72832.1 hypothetical protein GCM10007852_37400 [Agaribacter marinus]